MIMLAITGHVHGCVCVGFLTPKEEWQRSTLVFVGRVEKVTPGFDESMRLQTQRVVVRVEEPFKGVRKDQLIQIYRSNHCELSYSKNSRRLLYLDSQKGGLWLSPGCDRSADPDFASDDLRFLRALPRSAERTRISGEVILSGEPSRPLSDVSVIIRRSGGAPSTAVTDAKGIFEVYDLPKGAYTVTVRVKPGLKPKFGFVSGPRKFSDKFPLTVTLGDSDATAVFYLTSSTAM